MISPVTILPEKAFEVDKQIKSLKSDVQRGFLGLAKLLKRVRDEKLYELLDCDSFEEYIAQPELSFNRSSVFEFIAIYEKFVLELKVQPAGLVLTDWSKLQTIRPHVTEDNAEELLEKAQSLSRSDLREEMKPHVSHNSGENEWYTPPRYIEAARATMGSIDVDPASSEVANKTVKATKFYTEQEDGLTKQWGGTVWLNPPYSQPLIDYFSQTLVEKYKSGEIKQACVLVNNATETKWLQRILEVSSAVCFLGGRIKFLNQKGEAVGAPLQGQVILYLGESATSFEREFGGFGIILWNGEK